MCYCTPTKRTPFCNSCSWKLAEVNEKLEKEKLTYLAQLVDMEQKFKKILTLVKQEVANRNYVCTTNHAVFCDNAKDLLKEIGELKE